jgi:hypothetical protein
LRSRKRCDADLRDPLATFPADEIVVAVRPSDLEGLVESVATDSARNEQRKACPFGSS